MAFGKPAKKSETKTSAPIHFEEGLRDALMDMMETIHEEAYHACLNELGRRGGKQLAKGNSIAGFVTAMDVGGHTPASRLIRALQEAELGEVAHQLQTKITRQYNDAIDTEYTGGEGKKAAIASLAATVKDAILELAKERGVPEDKLLAPKETKPDAPTPAVPKPAGSGSDTPKPDAPMPDDVSPMPPVAGELVATARPTDFEKELAQAFIDKVNAQIADNAFGTCVDSKTGRGNAANTKASCLRDFQVHFNEHRELTPTQRLVGALRHAEMEPLLPRLRDKHFGAMLNEAMTNPYATPQDRTEVIGGLAQTLVNTIIDQAKDEGMDTHDIYTVAHIRATAFPETVGRTPAAPSGGMVPRPATGTPRSSAAALAPKPADLANPLFATLVAAGAAQHNGGADKNSDVPIDTPAKPQPVLSGGDMSTEFLHYLESFGKKLLDLREAAEISRDELAENMLTILTQEVEAVSDEVIREWEKDATYPDEQQFAALKKILIEDNTNYDDSAREALSGNFEERYKARVAAGAKEGIRTGFGDLLLDLREAITVKHAREKEGHMMTRGELAERMNAALENKVDEREIALLKVHGGDYIAGIEAGRAPVPGSVMLAMVRSLKELAANDIAEGDLAKLYELYEALPSAKQTHAAKVESAPPIPRNIIAARQTLYAYFTKEDGTHLTFTEIVEATGLTSVACSQLFGAATSMNVMREETLESRANVLAQLLATLGKSNDAISDFKKDLREFNEKLRAVKHPEAAVA